MAREALLAAREAAAVVGLATRPWTAPEAVSDRLAACVYPETSSLLDRLGTGGTAAWLSASAARRA